MIVYIQILELPSYSIIGTPLLCSFSGSGEWLITTLSKKVKGQKINGGIEHIHRHIYKNKMNRGHIWSISMLMFLLAVFSRIFVTFFHIFPQAVWRNSQAATASPLVEVQLSPLHWCEYWPRLIFLWTQLKCFVNVQTPPIRDAVRRSTVYWQTFQLAKIRRKLTHVSLLVRLHWLHRFINMTDKHFRYSDLFPSQLLLLFCQPFDPVQKKHFPTWKNCENQNLVSLNRPLS